MLDSATKSPGSRSLAPPNPHARLPVHGYRSSYELTPVDFEAMQRFERTIVQGFGAASVAKTYGPAVVTMGHLSPYLLHCYLAFTYIHERDVCLRGGSKIAAHSLTALAFHWHQATVLQRQLLTSFDRASTPQRDALQTGVMVLAFCSFGYLNTHNPAEHWPNKPTDHQDSQWFWLSRAKKVVSEMIGPFSPESVWYPTFSIHADAAEYPRADKPIPVGAFPSDFEDLFGLNETSSPKNNVFFTALSIFHQILPTICDDWNMLKFLSFTKDVNDSFLQMLYAKKDPRALLLLCFWWAKVSVFNTWWLTRRAVIEGTAIVLYLEKNHEDDARIMRLLRYPKEVLHLCSVSIPDAAVRSTYIHRANSPETRELTILAREPASTSIPRWL